MPTRNKMTNKKKRFDVRSLALSQIFLLVVGIVAISYAIGSEIEGVSGIEISYQVTDPDETTRTVTGQYSQGSTTLPSGFPEFPFEGDPTFYTRTGSSGAQVLSSYDGKLYYVSRQTGQWTPYQNPNFEITGTTSPFTATPGGEAANFVPPSAPVPASGQGEVLNAQFQTDVPEGQPDTPVIARPQVQGAGASGAQPSSIPFSAEHLSELASGKVPVYVGGQAGTLQAVPGGYQLIGGNNVCLDGCTSPLTAEQIAVEGLEGRFVTSNFLSSIGSGLVWALTVYGGIKFVFGTLLDQDPQLVDAVAKSAALGVLTAKAISGAGYGLSGDALGLAYASWAGVAVAVVYFVVTYEDQAIQVVTFTCSPWQAPARGNDCEKCNQGILPCSEYQCKSLGQSCDLVNKGTTEEKCVWVNRNDVNPPTIEPWEDALLTGYKYTPDKTISPPDRGVKIDYLASTNNCVPAFTPLKFGVSLNEPAKCKIDSFAKKDFENMSAFMSNGLSRYNHSFAFTLPGSANLEAEGIEIQNDGNYETYIRCQDANGNENVANFVFKYCVQKGPDTTPPLIVKTEPSNNVPVQFERQSLNTTIYANEPVECKWSHDDRDYDTMEESMDCSDGDDYGEKTADGLYICKTSLTGLKDRAENKFYFRCKDQPQASDSARNANKESFAYKVLGTQPLVIDSTTPNDETIKDSTNMVKVTLNARTSAGHDKGAATCYWSETGNEGDYIEFRNSRTFEHSQDLFLPEASYQYFIRCIDAGGNADNKEINFDVESDNDAPLAVRLYHEEANLKLTTNEPARCVYDVVDCSYEFDNGIKMNTLDDLSHFVNWDIKSNLYIKCRDEFQNQPLPNQCSVIARTEDFKIKTL